MKSMNKETLKTLTRATELVEILQAKLVEHTKKNFKNLTAPKLSMDVGRKYVRIVRDNDTQKSVYFFVDVTNGNVLKAAGWHAPETKNPRANVFDKDHGVSGIGPYGANYIVNTGYYLGW